MNQSVQIKYNRQPSKTLSVTKKCRLCGDQATLQNSHVIPRFVFRWVKKTGATPFLRNSENPDTRVQDYHEKLLCEDCEQSFSDYESKFASNIFYPFIDGKSTSFAYDEWLQRFIISISWRVIVSEQTDLSEFDHIHAEAIREAKDLWADILRGNLRLSTDVYTHYIFFLDDLADASNPDEVPDNWEFYIDRGIDATPVHGPGTTAIYFKLPQMLFFSCIQPPSDPQLSDLEVERSGEIGPPQTLGPDWGTFLINRADRVSSRSVSESEQEKIKERILENPKEALQSNSVEAFKKQMERKIENHDPTKHFGEECTVCHTHHRIIEFLPNRPLKKPEVERMAVKNPFLSGIYLDGELAVANQPEDVAPSFVLSSADETIIVTLYPDEGWVVEREIPHPEDSDPEEIGQMIAEGHRQNLVKWAKEQRANSI
ncbi:conserved hypothetical protein [Halorhabdus tiamatea SARL4B]|uniref:DUF7964 domain-containing protein n=1 Tax=Halorhabdus tiamatea SARL4B TaxID=1033806 RepID=S6CV77_9EURY|nr:conserved hypothetical protein [Halorhabdus tiamatea SARL4B]